MEIGETKEFLITEKNKDVVEYKVIVKEGKKNTKYSIFYSEEEFWSKEVRGKLALEIKDNGNEIKLEKKMKTFNYSDALYLRILLIVNEYMFGKNDKFELLDSERNVIKKF